MSVATETWVDKTSWGVGPWQDEPDRIEWRDETTGLPCLMRRSPLGAWCGYVALPPGHPWHGLDISDAPDAAHCAAHGSLTFAAPCMEDDRPLRERVCHVPQPGESDDVWWLGFDCAHAGDIMPVYGLSLLPTGSVYRDVTYVASCCADLASVAAGAVR